MKNHQKLCALFLSLSLFLPVSAQEGGAKIGTANMQFLLGKYFKTEQIRETFKGYEEVIQKQDKERVDRMLGIEDELKKMKASIDDEKVPREQKQEILTQATRKQQELEALNNDRRQWLERKQAALRDQAEQEFEVLRQEILGVLREFGNEEGYDYIFDRSGGGHASVAILAYGKDAADVTPALLEKINKDAPKIEETEKAQKTEE